MMFNTSKNYNVTDAYIALSELLKDNYPNPQNTALTLLRHTLQISDTSIFSDVDKSLTKSQLLELNKTIELINNDIPIAYITGNIEFYNEYYFVNQNTLIPRPESELLVELALNSVSQLDYSNIPIKCLEIGTGTGCLSISILNNTDLKLDFIATDISKKAIKIAEKNADSILTPKKRKQLKLLKQDFLQTTPPGRFDLIISNPPYIPLSEYKSLPKSLQYEPSGALTDSGDGLMFYRHIAKQLVPNLSGSGKLLVEIHSGKAKEVMQVFKTEAGTPVELRVHKDLFGRDRVIELTLEAQ